MRRAALDFTARPRPPTLGVVLFAVGCLAIGAAWWLSQRWAGEEAEVERAAQRLAAAREAAKPTPAPVLPAPAQRRYQLAQAELQRPWLPTLRAIETATRDPVFLLGLTVEPTTGAIRLEAEATTIEQATAYVQRLTDTQAMSGVILASHETAPSPGTAQNVVRFSVSARWRAP